MSYLYVQIYKYCTLIINTESTGRQYLNRENIKRRIMLAVKIHFLHNVSMHVFTLLLHNDN
jgi:hypothetical protein